MILNDSEIRKLCLSSSAPMISPFVETQCGKPSYGLGSFGYDMRLGATFLIPIGGVNTILDPLDFPKLRFTREVSHTVFEIGAHTQVLAESVEWFSIPDDVIGLAFGKSSYARCGLLCNLTPLEPGWRGHLTLELANLSPHPIRLHVGQGIAQVIFFKGERPLRAYGEKESGGLYQNQEGVLLPQ